MPRGVAFLFVLFSTAPALAQQPVGSSLGLENLTEEQAQMLNDADDLAEKQMLEAMAELLLVDRPDLLGALSIQGELLRGSIQSQVRVQTEKVLALRRAVDSGWLMLGARKPAVTISVFVDMTAPQGARTVKAALAELAASDDVAVEIIPVTYLQAGAAAEQPRLLNRVVAVLPRRGLRDSLDRIADEVLGAAATGGGDPKAWGWSHMSRLFRRTDVDMEALREAANAPEAALRVEEGTLMALSLDGRRLPYVLVNGSPLKPPLGPDRLPEAVVLARQGEASGQIPTQGMPGLKAPLPGFAE